MPSVYTIWPRITTLSSSSFSLRLYKSFSSSIHLLYSSNPISISFNSLMQFSDQEIMATSGCLQEQHNKHLHHPSHQLYLCSNKKSLRDIDIPPRKLLNRRASATSSESSFMDTMYHQQQQQNESPRVLPEETLFKKFLPYNSGVDSDDEDADPYAADHFRIYEFKVRKCTRSRSHDWTDCPFAHPGEKARRRCPRRYNYLGTVCADFRRGSCSRGDLCEFAHGVFECWLHPSRYRTEACKDGKNCQRKICFFAHTQRQLRVVPPETPVSGKKYPTDSSHCCAHCRCHLDMHHANSPTSTLNIDLDSLSPPASPPFSPARSGAGFSPISRFAERLNRGESFGMTQMGNNSCASTHKESMNELMMSNQSLNELMMSMEAMNMEENIGTPNMKSLWMDACFNGNCGIGAGGGSSDQQQSQFDRAVINPTPCGSDMGRVFTNDSRYNESSVNGPDLGWVNDLLT